VQHPARSPDLFFESSTGVDVRKPEEAAEGRRVFELHPAR
jgi:hypothetical protein